MKLVYRLQWATPQALENFKRDGTLFYTNERMEKLLSDSFEAGRKQGDSEGRVALRRLIESDPSTCPCKDWSSRS